MSEDRFEEFLKEAVQSYHPPPETPRERIWARIQEARGEGAAEEGSSDGTVREESSLEGKEIRPRPSRFRWDPRSPWVRWGLGLAAALAIGIGLGRLSLQGPGAPGPTAPGPTAAVEEEARMEGGSSGFTYRLAATRHLAQAEAFLTGVRADTRSGRAEQEFWASATDLLSSTRLLLDSPAAEDTRFRALLRELELVLVQIAQASLSGSTEEMDLVSEGMEEQGLLFRLRSAIPAGPTGSEPGASVGAS